MNRRIFAIVAGVVLLSLSGGNLSATSLKFGMVGEEGEKMDKGKQQGEQRTW
jgi:hypothetical protein